MTFTSKEAITGSFSILGQYTAFKKPTDTDYNRALTSLNSMLSMWYKLGLRAAYNTNTLTLEAPIPYGDYAQDAIEYALTERMWKKFAYNVSIPLEVVGMAKDLTNELWTIGAPIPKSVFPGTLPIGSGNEDYHYGGWSPFYPDCDERIYNGCDDNQLSVQSGVPLTGVDNV